jgi:hypothetical protein
VKSALANQQVALEWRFRRAVERVAVVDEVLADYATNWCRRPLPTTSLPAPRPPRCAGALRGDGPDRVFPSASRSLPASPDAGRSRDDVAALAAEFVRLLGHKSDLS